MRISVGVLVTEHSPPHKHTNKHIHARLTTTRGHTHTLSDINNETKTETSTHMKGNRHTRFDQSSVVCGGVVCVGVCVDPAEHVT